MKHISRLLAIFLLSVTLYACDDPSSSTPDDPPELITYVIVELVDSGNVSDTVEAMFSDPDGPSGSGQPVITGATIKHGRTYMGTIKLYQLIRSETADSIVDMSEEIREFGTQHQFFYTVGGQSPNAMWVEITDKDANNLPLGLEFKLHTQQGFGTIHEVLNVVLSHYEQAGSKNGVDPSGESDIDIDFPITIQ